MDSIFDEDVDEVGGEIEAYCPSPRCKADTTHTIISMYEDEVRRVQCVVCGEVHAYRKPRGDGPEEGGPEAAAPSKVQKTSKASWKDAMSRATEADLANCRPYSIRDTYEIGDVVLHPKFDIGFVIELLPDNKVAMVYRDEPEPRVLVHNRGDLATQMPGISEIPPPRDAKKKKRPKKKDDNAATISVRTEADVNSALEKARNAAAAKTEEGQRVVTSRLAEEKKKAKAKPAAKPPKGKAAPPPAKPAKPAKAEAKGKGAAKPAAKPAKAAAKPAKKPAKPAKAAKPAKKPAAKKPAAKKPAKPAKKKKK
jgi:hypothetical protein